jgi:hypothetical protein
VISKRNRYRIERRRDMPSWKLSMQHSALLPAGLVLAILIVAPVSTHALAGPTQAGPAFSVRQASAPPELEITFEEAAVVAADLTPGGDAVFWSVAREPQGYYQQIVRRQESVLVDALGEARFEPESGAVQLKSVWAVVDVTSGGFAVSAPPEFPLEEVAFPGRDSRSGLRGW